MTRTRHYGVDVALQRADDLDKKMIADVGVRVELGDIPRVLDVGCGGGGQSARLATAGAHVIGIDVHEYSDQFALLRNKMGLSTEQLSVTQGNMAKINELLGTQTFDLVCFQRVLHYVPYDIALKILTDIHPRIYEGGRCYVSVTGLESDIGLHYTDKHKSITDRFCRLNDTDAYTFSIHEPLCVYTPEECVDLLQEAGWYIQECWISAFGNIKAVCM